MALIVQKQTSPRNREILLMLLLLILISSLLATLIVFNVKEKETWENNQAEQAPYSLLQDALAYMDGEHALLHMEILERGEGYVLNFKGKKLGDKTLSGELVDYNLEIFQNNRGELYVRDLVSDMWTDAGDLQLDGLREFLVIPFELLDYHHQEGFQDAVFISDAGYAGEKVIKLSLPPQDFMPSFASTTENIDMECFLFIEEDNLFINRITFVIYNQSLQKELMNRTFFFNAASNPTRHLQVFVRQFFG